MALIRTVYENSDRPATEIPLILNIFFSSFLVKYPSKMVSGRGVLLCVQCRQAFGVTALINSTEVMKGYVLICCQRALAFVYHTRAGTG